MAFAPSPSSTDSDGELMQSLCLSFTLILVLTWGFRMIISPTRVTSVAQQVMIGIFLGKSFLGKKEIMGSYSDAYAKIFSVENQHILGLVGALGYLFSIFICGLRVDLIRPEKLAILMGILSMLIPFFVGLVVEKCFLLSSWELSRMDTKAFLTILYTLCFSPYPTLRFLLDDLNLTSTCVGRFVLSSSLVSELASSSVTWILEESYSIFNHASTKKDAGISLLWIFGLAVLTVLVIRPFLEWILKSDFYKESKKYFGWVFIAVVVGLMSKWFEDKSVFPTLVLGLVIPRDEVFVKTLETHVWDLSEILQCVYITLISMKMDVMSINLKENEVVFYGILVLATTTTRCFVCWKVSNKKFSARRCEKATLFFMTAKGVIELSTYTTLRDKQVISEGVCAILILNALGTSLVASYTRKFYNPNAKTT